MIHYPRDSKYKMDLARIADGCYVELLSTDGKFYAIDEPSEPGKRMHVGFWLKKKHFDEHVIWESVDKNRAPQDDPFVGGYSLWTNGMGSQTAVDVLIFTDDPDSGLFLAFKYLGMSQLLGRLCDDTEFTKWAMGLVANSFAVR